MSHRHVLGIAFGFVVCCFEADAQSVPAAQTFVAIRAAVRETIHGQRDFGLGFSDDGSRPLHKEYDLFLCREASDLGMRDNRLEVAATVALHVEIYQAGLTSLRVPESIWSRQLAAIDQLGVRSIQRYTGQQRSYDQLNEELERAEKSLADKVIAWGQSNSRLPQFIWDGGCGGFDAEVTITTTPRGARVSYIPLFQFKLCQARNLNPEDPTRCDGWINAVKVYEDMIGKYHYIATWSDGYQAKGVFDINGKATVNIRR